jgi:alpha-amylase
MARTIHLILCLHNHQPVGNLDFVMERAYEKAYLPFLEVLERHPSIPLALHWSGILLDWLEANHPEYIERARSLAERGQIEVLGGGYFEPILPIIPDRDKIGQMEKLSRKLLELFGTEPQGAWLAERVWEPSLPRPIAQAGLKYAIIDDEHFIGAGLTEEETLGAFLTEEQGYPLILFPSNAKARDSMPFRSPEDALRLILDWASHEPSRLLVMADDGEKFGEWPTTHETVYEKGWLERFFTLLEENAQTIRLTTPSRYLVEFRPRRKLYLPTASYMEMSRWALPAHRIARFDALRKKLRESGLEEDSRLFLRGGFWRSFLTKYPEASRLQAKMMRVSAKVARLEAQGTSKSLIKKAKAALWRGQCNCPYWHGVFGGVYFTHLRAANWKALLKAEALCDEKLLGKKEVSLEVEDYDLDGQEEIILENRYISATFKPASGGALLELDLKSLGINILDTFTRKPEAYHQDLPKDELIYDPYERLALIDHLLPAETTLHDFSRCLHRELGDFVEKPYDFKLLEKKEGQAVELSRKAHLERGSGSTELRITKTIHLSPREEGLSIGYLLENQGPDSLDVWFGVEWNLGLITDRDPSRRVEIPQAPEAPTSPGQMDETHEITEVYALDEARGFGLRLAWQKPARLWRFPIETVSQAILALEKTYQATCLLPCWKITLEPAQSWTNTFRLSPKKL